jgi:hypothetical protein
MIDVSTRIQEAVDGAHPAGMLGDDMFVLELATRLDTIAAELMASRPDLEVASLDEWLTTHYDELAPVDRDAASQIIDAYA